jgi:acetyltransferase-like isoleucine patch superfamily enzyme
MNQRRKDKYNQIKKMGYRFASFVNLKSELPKSVKIGENVAILDARCIQPFAKIFNNVLIWNGTIIGHHAIIKSHSWITSGANIGGNSTIGEKSFLGLNSTVGNMVKIGNNCFLGANSLITKNLNNNKVCINKDTSIFNLNTLKDKDYMPLKSKPIKKEDLAIHMLDTKHTDYMNQFSHENKSIIPTLEQELLEETNSNKQKVLAKKIKSLKDKQMEYYLTNSIHIFSYFENKKDKGRSDHDLC